MDPGGRSGGRDGGPGGVAVSPSVALTRRPARASMWRQRLRSVELLAVVVVAAILLRGVLVDLIGTAQASTFITVFVSVVVAGLPFVVLGSMAVAAITAFVPRAVVAGPPGLAGLARVLTPSAGVSRRSAALAGVAFLLASPAASPVVLAATAVAFAGQPMMVLARFVAGVITTAAMGALWFWLAARSHGPAAVAVAVTAASAVEDPEAEGGAAGARAGGAGAAGGLGGWPVFWRRCRVDVVRSGGVLAIGAFAVAVFTVWLPPAWLDAIAGTGLFAVVAMALLAVLLSVRAGADAFVAAALSQFSPVAALAFLVVGPAANLRLFTRQVARLGPGFAVRFAPATVLIGLVATLIIGWVLL